MEPFGVQSTLGEMFVSMVRPIFAVEGTGLIVMEVTVPIFTIVADGHGKLL